MKDLDLIGHVIFVIAGVVASAILFSSISTGAGFSAWLAASAAFGMVLKFLLQPRWRISNFLVWTLSMAWPMTILFAFWLIRTQEGLRRERLAREVMES